MSEKKPTKERGMSEDQYRRLAKKRGVPGPDTEEHAEGYDGECYCRLCLSYGDPR